MGARVSWAEGKGHQLGPGRKGRGVGFGWWTSGSGGVGGRGRASMHGAFLWVGKIVGSAPNKKSVFDA